MMEKAPLPVNTLSAEFKDGVEAGLNSPEDTNNWIAGNDLGRALNAEPGNESRPFITRSSNNPLFMRSSPERPRGNDQDEKDETEE